MALPFVEVNLGIALFPCIIRFLGKTWFDTLSASACVCKRPGVWTRDTCILADSIKVSFVTLAEWKKKKVVQLSQIKFERKKISWIDELETFFEWVVHFCHFQTEALVMREEIWSAVDNCHYSCVSSPGRTRDFSVSSWYPMCKLHLGFCQKKIWYKNVGLTE